MKYMKLLLILSVISPASAMEGMEKENIPPKSGTASAAPRSSKPTTRELTPLEAFYKTVCVFYDTVPLRVTKKLEQITIKEYARKDYLLPGDLQRYKETYEANYKAIDPIGNLVAEMNSETFNQVRSAWISAVISNTHVQKQETVQKKYNALEQNDIKNRMIGALESTLLLKHAKKDWGKLKSNLAKNGYKSEEHRELAEKLMKGALDTVGKHYTELSLSFIAASTF